MTTRTPYQQAYYEVNLECELWVLLKHNHRQVPLVSDLFQSAVKIHDAGRIPCEVHHIFRRTRLDNRSNLITVLKPIHDEYCHGTGLQQQACLLCLGAKLRKGELDWDEINEAAGKNVAGWLTENRPLLESWLRPLWDELVADDAAGRG